MAEITPGAIQGNKYTIQTMGSSSTMIRNADNRTNASAALIPDFVDTSFATFKSPTADGAGPSETDPSADLLHLYQKTLVESEPPRYLLDFEEEAAREAILVGEVALEDAEKERARKQVENLKLLAEEEAKHKYLIDQLDRQAQRAEASINDEGMQSLKQEEKVIEELHEKPKRAKKEMQSWFKESKRKIELFIRTRKTNIQQAYGELKMRDQHEASAMRVDWSKVPQNVEIRVQGIRGIKDKISEDVYILLLSKWTKLGGYSMRWSPRDVYSDPPPYCPLHPIDKTPFEQREACEICQGLVGCTEPQYHGATHEDLELILNSAVLGFFPPVATIKPYNVMIFELVRVEDYFAHQWELDVVENRKPRVRNPYNLAPSLGGRGSKGAMTGKRSRTVAWGAFPLINSKFLLIKGKYKLPLLRGPVDDSVTHFRIYEAHLRDDLEGWLGNLYFEAIPYPREKEGHTEFELDQKYSRDVLGLKDMGYFELADKAKWIGSKDKEQQQYGALPVTPSAAGEGDHFLTARLNQATGVAKRRKNVYVPMVRRPDKRKLLLVESESDISTDSGRDASTEASLSEELASETDEVSRSARTHSDNGGGGKKKPPAVWIPSSVRKALADSADRKKKGKRVQTAPIDDDLVKELKEFNKNLRAQERQLVDRSEKWAKYRYSIEPDGTFAEYDYRWKVQLQFVTRTIIDELGLLRPFSLRFWFACALFFCTVWLQLYVRGVGLYCGLRMLNIPIGDVSPKFYGLIVDYKAHYMFAFDEIFVVCIAGIFNMLVIWSTVLVGWFFKLHGTIYPEQLSKFMFLLSIGLYIIPFVNLIIDAIQHEDDSDWNRLMRFFITKRYSRFFGGITWIILYLLSVLIITFVLYMYTMYVHLNGILIDSYTRINVINEEIAEHRFLPLDFEVSMMELQYIVEKAERWRGAHGERKKTLVEEIITTDSNDPDFHEVNVRVTIFILDVADPQYHTYKPKKVWREFFVLSRGSIVEAVNNRAPPSASYVLDKIDNTFAISGPSTFTPRITTGSTTSFNLPVTPNQQQQQGKSGILGTHPSAANAHRRKGNKLDDPY